VPCRSRITIPTKNPLPVQYTPGRDGTAGEALLHRAPSPLSQGFILKARIPTFIYTTQIYTKHIHTAPRFMHSSYIHSYIHSYPLAHHHTFRNASIKTTVHTCLNCCHNDSSRDFNKTYGGQSLAIPSPNGRREPKHSSSFIPHSYTYTHHTYTERGAPDGTSVYTHTSGTKN